MRAGISYFILPPLYFSNLTRIRNVGGKKEVWYLNNFRGKGEKMRSLIDWTQTLLFFYLSKEDHHCAIIIRAYYKELCASKLLAWPASNGNKMMLGIWELKLKFNYKIGKLSIDQFTTIPWWLVITAHLSGVLWDWNRPTTFIFRSICSPPGNDPEQHTDHHTYIHVHLFATIGCRLLSAS